ncbi:MAG: hypothetical protein EHM41_18240 [Chloroflexi bacterium]|nr:MAG: hypothetical protein EHM41_18240 [Chloroflexota bacterium]
MKKIILPSIILILLAAFLLIVWLDKAEVEALPPMDVHAPEDSAIRYVREMESGNFTISSNSVEAIQTVELKDLVLVLVQYSGTRRGGGVETCEMVLETEKVLIRGWETKSGSSLCHEVDDPTNSVPITIGSSMGNSTLLNPGYSTIYGFVRDPQITKVVVTWDDGQIQPLEVQVSTYLAAREGASHMIKIEAHNDQNEIVFQTRLGTVE